MATATTHDLIKCNRVFPTLPSVNPVGIAPYNGMIVRFDGDNRRSYKVRRNVQGRFLHPEIPAEGYDMRYRITSMKFNAVELLAANPVLTIGVGDITFTSFPEYTIGNELLYTANIANGVIVADSGVSLGLGINNVYTFIESVVNTYDIPVKVSRSPELWWSPEAFPRINNIIFEKYYDDDFEYTMSVTQIDVVTQDEVTEVHRYVFNDGTVTHFVDGVDITTTPAPVTDHPQYSELYSFFSYDYDYETIEQVPACPIYEPFNTSLDSDNCSSIDLSCDCRVLSFSDTSNYISNGLPGHDPELFTSRTIKITKPNGTTYIYGTSDVDPKDQLIGPHYSSPNTFQYILQPNDVDGIYNIQVCSYPDWNAEVFYELFVGTIVRRNGKLYKVKASNTNADPSLPENAAYWTEYTCTTGCDDTRYCASSNVVVLCISILKCYKDLVREAFCAMESNPCKNMCDNPKFIQAMKFRVTMDSLELAVCDKDWNSVKKHFDLLKSLCCCNG